MKKRTPRKIDQAFSESRSWLSKKVILVKKSKLINLKNLIILAFIAGAIIATIWIVDTNKQTSSQAATSCSADGTCCGLTHSVDGRCTDERFQYWCNEKGDGGYDGGNKRCIGTCCVPVAQTRICGDKNILASSCCTSADCGGKACDPITNTCTATCASGFKTCPDGKCAWGGDTPGSGSCCSNLDCPNGGTCSSDKTCACASGFNNNCSGKANCQKCCADSQCASTFKCINGSCQKDCSLLCPSGICGTLPQSCASCEEAGKKTCNFNGLNTCIGANECCGGCQTGNYCASGGVCKLLPDGCKVADATGKCIQCNDGQEFCKTNDGRETACIAKGKCCTSKGMLFNDNGTGCVAKDPNCSIFNGAICKTCKSGYQSTPCAKTGLCIKTDECCGGCSGTCIKGKCCAAKNQILCNGQCTNVDYYNCGSCGNVCRPPQRNCAVNTTNPSTSSCVLLRWKISGENCILPAQCQSSNCKGWTLFHPSGVCT